MAILIKPRDVAAIWAWLLVLFALPGVGFVLFIFGRGLTDKKILSPTNDLKELENFQSLEEIPLNITILTWAIKTNSNLLTSSLH